MSLRRRASRRGVIRRGKARTHALAGWLAGRTGVAAGSIVVTIATIRVRRTLVWAQRDPSPATCSSVHAWHESAAIAVTLTLGSLSA